MEHRRRLYSMKETAEILGVGHTTLYGELIGKGRLKVVKIGKRTLATDQEIDRVVEELTREADDATA